MYVFSCSVVSDLCDPEEPSSSVHGDSPGKNSGVYCHSLLQGIFPIQKSNPGLPHCRWILYCQPPVKHMTNLDSTLKSRDIALLTKVCTVKAMVFPVVMYGYESWTIKKRECQRTDVFELWYWIGLLRVLWTASRSNPVILKWNQSWIFTGRTDPEAEVPILWPPDPKCWHIRKDPDAGKDWRQGEKGATENKMVGWQHRLKGHEFEQALEDGIRQGCLTCCSPRCCKWVDMTEQLKNNIGNPTLAQCVSSW